MFFREFMSASELLGEVSSLEEKRKLLIAYAVYLHSLYKRPLTKRDFSVENRVSYETINRYFGTFGEFFTKAGLPTSRRKIGLSEGEMRTYLISIRDVTPEGCWITTQLKDASDPEGRMRIKYKGKRWRIYRLSYLLFTGPIENGKEILHDCDNPRCFNPEHLTKGTHKENMLDAANKGRLIPTSRKGKSITSQLTDPYNYKDLIEFIKANSQVSLKNEWLYKGQISVSGYPVYCIKKKNYYLPRLVLANKINKKYEDVLVTRHLLPDGSKPDKRDLNPDHLIEGSASDNSKDARSYSKSSKLSETDVESIKLAINSNKTAKKVTLDKELAKKYGVSESTIAKIRLNQIWT